MFAGEQLTTAAVCEEEETTNFLHFSGLQGANDTQKKDL